MHATLHTRPLVPLRIQTVDATDESVLGEGGESGGEEGEDEEEGDEEEKRKGAGFSMEDLTDLEDASSSGSSPGGEDSPDAAVDLQPGMFVCLDDKRICLCI